MQFGHTAGLRMLRVAAAIRDELVRDALGPLVTAYGESYWDRPKGSGMRTRLSTPEHVVEVLEAAGLPTRFAESLDDDALDELLDAESELALSRTGRDVCTPIVTFQPPDGLSFFGPVMSRVPNDDEAVELWDAETTLAKFPGFAELKRSMREVPQLTSSGKGPTRRSRRIGRAAIARATSRPTNPETRSVPKVDMLSQVSVKLTDVQYRVHHGECNCPPNRNTFRTHFEHLTTK